MLLGEPPRTQGDLNFRLLGVPVRIHPLFWLVALLLNYRAPDLPSLLLWVVAVMVGVLIHEFGHATMMRVYGFYPWITLYGMGGLASYHPGSYTVRGRSTLAQVLIAAAGPAAGFLAAGLILLGVRAAGYQVAAGFFGGIPVVAFQPLPLTPLDLFLRYLLQVCVYWGLLNLLPIVPLDGGQIASQMLLAVNPSNGQRQALMLSVVVAVLMAAMSLMRWNDMFLGLLFGYMAYGSYQALQAYSGRRYF
jgi:stage IV sporulation protein FB